MFKIGDTVLYGSEGVCRITEITEKRFGDTAIEYYILRPVFSEKSTFFVPTSSAELTAKMHPILNNTQIADIIEDSGEIPEWNNCDNKRRDEFKEIISGGEIKKIVSLLKSIFNHKNLIEVSGKKLHKSDETAYKEAQKILYEEFSMVMDITRESVIDIVNGKTEIKIK